jgi:hypothetical protein
LKAGFHTKLNYFRGQEPGVGRSKKNKGYTDLPAFLVKIRDAPLLPVRLEIDSGRADDRLAVKGLEDRQCLVWSFLAILFAYFYE